MPGLIAGTPCAGVRGVGRAAALPAAGVFVTITSASGSGLAGAGTPPGGVSALAGARPAGARPTAGSGWVSTEVGTNGFGTPPGDPNGESFVIEGMPIEGVSDFGRIRAGAPTLGDGCVVAGEKVPGFGIEGMPIAGVASLSRGNGPCSDSTGTDPRAAAVPGTIGTGRELCDDAMLDDSGAETRPLGAPEAMAFGTPVLGGMIAGPAELAEDDARGGLGAPGTVAARIGRPVTGSSGTCPNGRPVRGSITGCAPVGRPVGDGEDAAVAARAESGAG